VTITAGNGVAPDASQTLTLVVQGPPSGTPPGSPSVAIITPASGATFNRGELVRTSFSCTDDRDGPGIASCVDQNGHTSDALLDTSTPGSHTLVVTARSLDGLSTSSTVSYTVLATTTTRVHVRARIHVSAIRIGHLPSVCADESSGGEREPSPAATSAMCRRVQLVLRGTIRAGRKLAFASGGTIRVSWKVRLPLGAAAGSAHARVKHGHWYITILVAADPHDPQPSSYAIGVSYSGDQRIALNGTRLRIRIPGR
jgi:hypothetical protein